MDKIIEEMLGDEKNPRVFIIDVGNDKYQDSDTKYEWNTKRYNRIRLDDLFLKRIPKNKNKGKKCFEFLSCGRFMKISETKQENIVNAELKVFYNFSLEQNDPIIENFEFSEKKRDRDKGWKNFFHQYGITEITSTDLKKLLIELKKANRFEERKKPSKNLIKNTDRYIDVDEKEVIQNRVEKFEVNVHGNIEKGKSKDLKEKKNRQKKELKNPPNFVEIQKKKIEIGDLGEKIVLKYLENTSTGKVEHIANTDVFAGYDILVTYENGSKEYIEVKSIRKNKQDDFIMTKNEFNKCKEFGDKYSIYRVCNIDEKKGKCDIFIFKHPFEELLTTTPYNYKVNYKKKKM